MLLRPLKHHWHRQEKLFSRNRRIMLMQIVLSASSTRPARWPWHTMFCDLAFSGFSFYDFSVSIVNRFCDRRINQFSLVMLHWNCCVDIGHCNFIFSKHKRFSTFHQQRSGMWSHHHHSIDGKYQCDCYGLLAEFIYSSYNKSDLTIQLLKHLWWQCVHSNFTMSNPIRTFRI